MTEVAQKKTTKRRKKAAEVDVSFGFFHYIWLFYAQNRGSIRQHYKELSKKFLDFNDPEGNPKAFLRQPQFEALEVYIFLKEFLGNQRIEHIFRDWYDQTGRFAGRSSSGHVGGRQQGDLLVDTLSQSGYEAIFDQMRQNARSYPNYIFALTMGTGKTILMAACIFYEFLLANKFPKDERFCHNALVFAPDKTVLQSLREIETFDLAKVVPPEYAAFLTTNVRFHYLEEAGVALSVIDRSRFNIIVSNTQKIILRRQNKSATPADKLFSVRQAVTYNANTAYADAADLYDLDAPEDEVELTTNQRFEKLRRLEQLGIYVDEAHHSFGKALAKDMGVGPQSDTSLRTTIDRLAESLTLSGTRVVACFNYTGTPYVGSNVLPEVVYAYGLAQAIKSKYLKQVRINDYSNVRSEEFVRLAVGNFLEETENIVAEGMKPKMAFFAATIDELQKELKPALEAVLNERGIPISKILVNVGDEKLTSNDDIRAFNRLDTPESDHQFILLVNKGREGWNCRSLFAVALFRSPSSKVFVLQATMRCLRSIGEVQHTGHVYLSEENKEILDKELQQNFLVTSEELQQINSDKEIFQVRVNMPIEKIKLRRVRRSFEIKEKELKSGAALGLDKKDKDKWEELIGKYRLIHKSQDGLPTADRHKTAGSKVQDLTHLKTKRDFSPMTLVAEISRYLNRPPLEIENILSSTKEGMDGIVEAVNDYNELLYDVVIPRLFGLLYDLLPTEDSEEHEVELIRLPPTGRDYYEVSASPEDVITDEDSEVHPFREKSFHLDTYCFDSKPEKALFWDLLQQNKVKKIYFTGMLTHGQSDFYIQYIDPDSHMVRSYYPDFLFQKEDGTYVIVEVKADGLIDDPVVQAKKQYARQIAAASNMEYRIIKATDARDRHFQGLID